MSRPSRSSRPDALQAAQAALPFLPAADRAQRQFLLVHATEVDGTKLGSGAALLAADEESTIEIRRDAAAPLTGVAAGVQVELKVLVTPDRTGAPLLAYAAEATRPARMPSTTAPARLSVRGRVVGETLERISLRFSDGCTAVVKLFILEAGEDGMAA